MSLRCLPFRRAFFEELKDRPISSQELCQRQDWPQVVFAPFGVERAEAHFNWLIRLGVLRREVDGQGLTERVRLTPLGRQVLARWPGRSRGPACARGSRRTSGATGPGSEPPC